MFSIIGISNKLDRVVLPVCLSRKGAKALSQGTTVNQKSKPNFVESLHP
jgi:hypothetical protein